MSTTVDVLNSIKDLLNSINDLLNTETAKTLPKIADALQAKPQFDDVIGVLVTVISKIKYRMEPICQTVLGADALLALFGVLPPVVDGLGTVLKDVGKEFSDQFGLDFRNDTTASAEIVRKASRALGKSEDIGEEIIQAAGGAAWLPLRASLEDVKISVEKLKEPASDAKPPGPAEDQQASSS